MSFIFPARIMMERESGGIAHYTIITLLLTLGAALMLNGAVLPVVKVLLGWLRPDSGPTP